MFGGKKKKLRSMMTHVFKLVLTICLCIVFHFFLEGRWYVLCLPASDQYLDKIIHNGYDNMQKLIFEEPEDGVRKIVLATNIAETSITINDIVFVIDCGKAKETSYDALNNTPCLLPTWISKVSAQQVS